MTDAKPAADPGMIQAYDLVVETLRLLQVGLRAYADSLGVGKLTGDPTIDAHSGGLWPGDVLRLTGPRRDVFWAAIKFASEMADIQSAEPCRVVLVCPGWAPSLLGAELLAATAGVSPHLLRHGHVDAAGLERVIANAQSISQQWLFVDTVSTSLGALDRRLHRQEGRESVIAGWRRLVVIVGANASWTGTRSGEALGLRLRRLARRRRTAVLWVEEAEAGGYANIPAGLLTGELTMAEPGDDRTFVLDWHRRGGAADPEGAR